MLLSFRVARSSATAFSHAQALFLLWCWLSPLPLSLSWRKNTQAAPSEGFASHCWTLLLCIQTLLCSPLANTPTHTASTKGIFPEEWQKYHCLQQQFHLQSWFAHVLPPSSSSTVCYCDSTNSQPRHWNSTTHQRPSQGLCLMAAACKNSSEGVWQFCFHARRQGRQLQGSDSSRGTCAPSHGLGIHLSQRKFKYCHSFCTSYPLSKRRAFQPPHPQTLKIHAPSSVFLSVQKRDFSNTSFTEVGWVKLPRLPQVTWKAKQCIDKTHTLNLNIIYLQNFKILANNMLALLYYQNKQGINIFIFIAY